MIEWFADDGFWQTFYPILFTEERFAAAEEQVEKALKLVGFEGRSVLDLACGPGRHSLLLAQKGFEVTGVDLSPFLLAQAKERAAEAGVEVEWVQQDMRSFRRPQAFDLCLSMYTSFGYFESEADDRAVLNNIHDSLREGGACLIDVIGKEWLAKHLQTTSSRELQDGTLMIERREITDDWSTVRNRWIRLKEGKADDYRFEHGIYSAQELKDRLAAAGFSTVEIHGNLDGAEYGPQAERLIAVARK